MRADRSSLVRLLLPLIVVGAVGGCAGTPAASAPGVRQARSVTVTGSLGAARRLVLGGTLVGGGAFVAADITGFKIYLRRQGQDEALLGELPGNARSLKIADLAPNTAYTVRIEAYQNTTRIDAKDVRCQTDFETGTDEVLEGVTFKLKLRDLESDA